MTSPYLFQKTSSSVLLIGINGGRNFLLHRSGRLFLSPYVGLGYANIGEPRLGVNNTANVIEQTVERTKGLFVRQGLRFGYTTKSRILQTLYVDVAGWRVYTKVQDSRPGALAFVAGTRLGF